MRKWKSMGALAVAVVWLGIAGSALAMGNGAGEMQQSSIAAAGQKKTDCLDLVKITPEEAMRIAAEKTNGKVLSLDLKKRHGFLVYQVKTITPVKSVVKVTVDPGTGDILRVKERGSKQA
jgi:uncharacterized membrane protein YkoI